MKRKETAQMKRKETAQMNGARNTLRRKSQVLAAALAAGLFLAGGMYARATDKTGKAPRPTSWNKGLRLRPWNKLVAKKMPFAAIVEGAKAGLLMKADVFPIEKSSQVSTIEVIKRSIEVVASTPNGRKVKSNFQPDEWRGIVGLERPNMATTAQAELRITAAEMAEILKEAGAGVRVVIHNKADRHKAPTVYTPEGYADVVRGYTADLKQSGGGEVKSWTSTALTR